MLNKIKEFINNFSVKQFWIGVGLLIVLRFIIVFFVMFGGTALEFCPRDFAFNGCEGNHGDKTLYYRLAEAFAHFDIYARQDRVPIGMGIYLTPYAFLFNSESFYDVTKPATIVSVFIFYSIAIVLICFISRIFLKSNIWGLAVGLIFILFPAPFYILNLGPYSNNYGTFINLSWLNSGLLTDAPSALITFVLFYYALKFVIDEKLKMRDYVFYGFFWGIACLIRESNIIFIFATAYVMLRRLNVKGILFSALTFVLVYSPQLIYNYLARGSFLNNGIMANNSLMNDYHLFKMGTIARGGLTPENYLYFLSVMDKYIPYLSLLLILGIIFFMFSIVYIYKFLDKKYLILMLLWILPFMALFASNHTGARAVRYWLPIIPHMIIMVICGLLFIFNIKKIIKEHDKE